MIIVAEASDVIDGNSCEMTGVMGANVITTRTDTSLDPGTLDVQV
jgi:hypothetical protein